METTLDLVKEDVTHWITQIDLRKRKIVYEIRAV